MDKLTKLYIVLVPLGILSYFYYKTLPRKETFGSTSPGTLVQLVSSHA